MNHDSLLSIKVNDRQLKSLRCYAHVLFRKWVKFHNFKTNGRAYQSLSERLDIPLIECHFGRMEKDRIKKIMDYMENELKFNLNT